MPPPTTPPSRASSARSAPTARGGSNATEEGGAADRPPPSFCRVRRSVLDLPSTQAGARLPSAGSGSSPVGAPPRPLPATTVCSVPVPSCQPRVSAYPAPNDRSGVSTTARAPLQSSDEPTMEPVSTSQSAQAALQLAHPPPGRHGRRRRAVRPCHPKAGGSLRCRGSSPPTDRVSWSGSKSEDRRSTGPVTASPTPAAATAPRTRGLFLDPRLPRGRGTVRFRIAPCRRVGSEVAPQCRIGRDNPGERRRRPDRDLPPSLGPYPERHGRRSRRRRGRDPRGRRRPVGAGGPLGPPAPLRQRSRAPTRAPRPASPAAPNRRGRWPSPAAD